MVTAYPQAVAEGLEDLDFFRLAKAPFLQSPSDSIEYAVVKKTDCAAVVPLDLGWNDIGSWSALWQIDQKDNGYRNNLYTFAKNSYRMTRRAPNQKSRFDPALTGLLPV